MYININTGIINIILRVSLAEKIPKKSEHQIIFNGIVLFSLCSCVQQHLNAILDIKDTVQLSLFTSQESH